MKRWKCEQCGSGRLAPARPRKNDARRYCFPCSEKAGVLVERICPSLEAEQEMSEYIDSFAASVRRILERSPFEQNDFVGLAISGEQLRRACEIGAPSDDAKAALHEYDAFLRNYDEPSTDGLRECLKNELTKLEDYAAHALHERDKSRGKELLLRIDETLSVGAAGTRAKILASDQLDALAKEVSTRVRRVASRCIELAQYAEDRQLLFGADPSFPALYDWWESLAQLSASRVALESTVTSAARRERILTEALKNFDAKHSTSVLGSLVSRKEPT